MDKHGWLRCSVVGVAALVGVPNIGFPLDGIIDRVFDQIDAGKRNKVRTLAEHAADTLAFRKHNHDAGTVESARLTATELLRDFGLSDQALADDEIALDADKAATAVINHGKFTVDEHAEIKPLCHQIVVSFYESVLLEPQQPYPAYIWRCQIS